MSAVPASKTRKMVVRGLLLVVYVGIAAFMLLIGRQHTILIDNKSAEDGSYEAIDGILVSIDGKEGAEYYSGDRDKATVQGQSHKIRIEVFSDGTVTEKTFRVPLWEDMTILSVPKLLAGIEPFNEKFVPLTVVLPAEDQQQYTSLPAEEPAVEGVLEELLPVLSQ